MNSPRRTSPHPDGSKFAHEWIAIYGRKFMPSISKGQIDYDDGGQQDCLSARSLKDPISMDGNILLRVMPGAKE